VEPPEPAEGSLQRSPRPPSWISGRSGEEGWGKGRKMETGEKGEGQRKCLKGIMKAKEENEKGTRMEKREGKGQREGGGGEKGRSPLYSFLKVGAYDAYEFCRYCRAQTYLSHPESGPRAGT